MSLTTLFALLSPALAADLEQAETTPQTTPPIYVASRGSVAVPANGHGEAAAAGLGLGVLLDESNSLGLRFIYMADPPDNPLQEYTPEVPQAWGPVLDWTLVFDPQSRASFYSNVSLGYVYGTPIDESEDNVILPILEGGIGLRFSKSLRSGSQLFLSPEIGFVPGAVAPYSAINLGMIFPGREEGA